MICNSVIHRVGGPECLGTSLKRTIPKFMENSVYVGCWTTGNGYVLKLGPPPPNLTPKSSLVASAQQSMTHDATRHYGVGTVKPEEEEKVLIKQLSALTRLKLFNFDSAESVSKNPILQQRG